MIAAGSRDPRAEVRDRELITVSLLGVDCELSASGPLALPLREAIEQLPTSQGGPHAGRWELRGEPEGVSSLTLDQVQIFAGSPDDFLTHMWCSLTTRVLDLTPYVAFHAGVVATGAGAIAFPGPSGTGKSCLTAALALRGWDLVSDEVLAMDPSDDRVVAFPRPLSMTPAGCRLVGIDPGPWPRPESELRFTASDLRSRWSEGMSLAHVVSLRRGTGPARLDPLDRVRSVQLLLGNSFNHHRRPTEAFALATRLARRSRTWTLTYDRPAQATEVLTQLSDNG